MDIIQKSINYLKSLSAETVSYAKTGHSGSAISASTLLFALFKDHLKFNPADSKFFNRDRFVLSAGHVCALYYSLLHLFGYDISIDDLKHFRKSHSKTPGHPEYGVVPGVEVTTGPLGQGVANAVGMAIAESMFASKFNRPDFNIFSNNTYCYAGDGCLMEGVAVEACSLAGTLKLNKLILLYDDNNITIDGNRTIANTEDTAKKFEAMGWNVIEVADGHNYSACTNAIAKARTSTDKPTIIIFKTIIGIGTTKQDTPKVHAYPLPEEELEAFKASLGISESFFVPADVYEYCAKTVKTNQIYEHAWDILVCKYQQIYAEDYNTLKSYFCNKKINYQAILKILLNLPETPGRDLSKLVLNEIAKINIELVGGSADLITSTKAVIENGGEYSPLNRTGRNIHYGIREHAMGAISNGISVYAELPTFDSTFMAFSTYMMPALRMRSMMKLPSLSIYTHDSIEVGPDGPTHQPIEQLSQIRSIPGFTVYRSACPAEVVAGYKLFIEKRIPMALIFAKSKLPKCENVRIEDAEKGGYVIFETGNSVDIQIISTGKDVELAIEVAKSLKGISVRVISMPCESLFATQSVAYKNKVLSKDAKLTAIIEASNDSIWHKYAGENGFIVSVDSYQTSGSSGEVYAGAGFNAKNIVSLIKKKLK